MREEVDECGRVIPYGQLPSLSSWTSLVLRKLTCIQLRQQRADAISSYLGLLRRSCPLIAVPPAGKSRWQTGERLHSSSGPTRQHGRPSRTQAPVLTSSRLLDFSSARKAKAFAYAIPGYPSNATAAAFSCSNIERSHAPLLDLTARKSSQKAAPCGSPCRQIPEMQGRSSEDNTTYKWIKREKEFSEIKGSHPAAPSPKIRYYPMQSGEHWSVLDSVKVHPASTR